MSINPEPSVRGTSLLASLLVFARSLRLKRTEDSLRSPVNPDALPASSSAFGVSAGAAVDAKKAFDAESAGAGAAAAAARKLGLIKSFWPPALY